MSIVGWAKRELEILEKEASMDGEESSVEMQRFMNKTLIEVVEVFANQGHSGCSASYAVEALRRLLSWTPLTDLTGEDDEWMEIDPGGLEQNTRCSRIFRENKDNDTAVDIEGRVFSDDGGITWYSGKGSRVKVIFPYTVPINSEKIYLDKDGSEITCEERKKELRDECEGEMGL